MGGMHGGHAWGACMGGSIGPHGSAQQASQAQATQHTAAPCCLRPTPPQHSSLQAEGRPPVPTKQSPLTAALAPPSECCHGMRHASCMHRVCIVYASCVHRVCIVRASCVHRACIVRASCWHRAIPWLASTGPLPRWPACAWALRSLACGSQRRCSARGTRCIGYGSIILYSALLEVHDACLHSVLPCLR